MLRLSITFFCVILLVLVVLAGWPEPSPRTEDEQETATARIVARETPEPFRFPEGTRVVVFTVPNNQVVQLEPGMAVDIVGRSDSRQSSNTLLNVILLAIESPDGLPLGTESAARVALTTAQEADLFLMLEQGITTFSIRRHGNEQRNP